MLDKLRKNSGGIVAKLFIGLLALSFAVWGVADIFSGYRAQAVITVGDTEISAQEYQAAYQREMQQTGQQLGRSLSLDEARALGLEGRVLSRLLTEATLDNDARARDLGITTDLIARSITTDPAFQDSFGRFNKSRFEQILRANGLDEQDYIQIERQTQLRRQVSAAVTAGSVAPQTLVEALYRYQEERRTIAYFELRPSTVEPIATPTEGQLSLYYEEHKSEFREPEFRKAEIIDASTDKLATTIHVAEEDIQAAYEGRKDEFATPERRTVQQIVFSSEEEARAAAQRLKDGAGFMEVAKDRGMSENDVSLGTVAKSEIGDPVVADAAFSLEEGAHSEPVKGRLATVIVRVTGIEQGSMKSLDEVRDNLRADLVRRQAQDMAYEIFDKVEDERASGATFKEIADKLQLDYRVIDAIDARGRGKDGKPVENLPASSELVRTIAENDPGVELNAVTAGAGFAWVNVLDVIPDRQQPLEEVREEVAEAWSREERRQRLAEKANELLDRARSGASLDTLAQEAGMPLVTTPPMQRNASNEVMSRAAMQSAFATPVQGFASAVHANGDSRLIMQVTGSEVPSFDPQNQEAQRLAQDISDSMASGQLSQYLAARQDRFGVQINQQTLQTLLGGNR